MNFPALNWLCTRTRQCLAREEQVDGSGLCFAVSPYRICPLGAHVDHQGGAVLGRTIDAHTVLAFTPRSVPEMRVHSLNFGGSASIDLRNPAAAERGDWSRYAAAAARALAERRELRTGLVGAVVGALPGGGLSSSASVGLAYLTALAAVNRIVLEPRDLIELSRRLENDYLGLRNGILDQSTIVHGRQRAMLHIATRTGAVEYVADAVAAEPYGFLVAYSGYSRELTSTGFNQRVEECEQAARLLAERARVAGARTLSDLPVDVFRRFGGELPPELGRRASHYYSEVARVETGRDLWHAADLVGFGELMNESCRSSIRDYECGSEPLKTLQEVVCSARGVFGSRFSGGGYGGCVVGLVAASAAEQAAKYILDAYADTHPEVREQARVFLTRSESCLRLA